MTTLDPYLFSASGSEGSYQATPLSAVFLFSVPLMCLWHVCLDPSSKSRGHFDSLYVVYHSDANCELLIEDASIALTFTRHISTEALF